MPPTLRRTIHELALHAWPFAGPEDSVLVHQKVPDDFAGYLEKSGLGRPRSSVLPDIDRDAVFTPFGWNRQAIELNRRFTRPSPHPPLAVVRRVNGRPFAALLAGRLFDDRSTLGRCCTTEAVEESLRTVPAGSPVVVKSRHGNAAFANRRLTAGPLEPPERLWLQRIFAEDEDVVIEHWSERRLDLCTSFEIGEDGSMRRLAIHEAINTADGAFIGSIFDDHNREIAPWRTELEQAASAIGDALAHEGYFGAVCLDAFVWNDANRHRLRPLVEINARLHVSAAIQHLCRSFVGSGAALWRFYNLRKLQAPATYREFAESLGNDHYDPVSGRGLLLTSPLILNDGTRPCKLGLLFVGRDRDDVLARDRDFRARFEGQKNASVR